MENASACVIIRVSEWDTNDAIPTNVIHMDNKIRCCDILYVRGCMMDVCVYGFVIYNVSM